jgi:Mn2+/Fe2+ NRAMP family transporter
MTQMNKSFPDNPYHLTGDKIIPAPISFWQRMRYLGPGFILSASIVGSGELIATTRLGAEAGFVTLWVILVSCLVKVSIQLEFGKRAIYTGGSTMEAFNSLPGWRLGKAHWTIWTWLVLMILKIIQNGGIIGGIAIILQIIFPDIPIPVWCFLVAITVSLLIYRGKYKPIEKYSLIFIGLFAILTFASLIAVQFTPLQITLKELLSGLKFQLPPEAVIVAIGAFGITGVGGDEIMAYNYWLIEKGYAANSGPREKTKEWENRARGWIKVMYLDAFLSMVVYTIMTAAFYLLGAAILHRQELLPAGMEVVETLSRLYTESLGNWAGMMFLIGGFIVLFSTLFSALAAWSRLFSDAFGQIGWIDFKDSKQRHLAIGIFAWFFAISWATLFLLMKMPVLMVTIGGVITTVILLIVVFAALHFRYRQVPEALKSGILYDSAFWISVVAIGMVAIYGIYKLI